MVTDDLMDSESSTSSRHFLSHTGSQGGLTEFLFYDVMKLESRFTAKLRLFCFPPKRNTTLASGCFESVRAKDCPGNLV